jgi:hypothetical protein
MRSLQDEWISDHPTLIDFAALLKQQPNTFRMKTITRDFVEDFCLTYSINGQRSRSSDLLSTQARGAVESVISWSSFLCSAMHIFYIAGIVGLMTEDFQSYQWAHEGQSTIVADTIGLKTSVKIHPLFFEF